MMTMRVSKVVVIIIIIIVHNSSRNKNSCRDSGSSSETGLQMTVSGCSNTIDVDAHD